MSSRYTVLVLNPGSTSTKVSLFHGEDEASAQTLRHSTEELARFESVIEQEDLRATVVSGFLGEHLDGRQCDAVIGRGGLLKPVDSGVYRVNQAMLDDLRACTYGAHASNLGAILADRIARRWKCPAFIADPVVVDELAPESRLSGIPEISRKSIFHALNQKSAAREVASSFGRSYEELNMIVAHLGGGISVGAHQRGRVVDVNNALDGDGPFSPERAGGLPVGQVAELARRMSADVLRKHLVGRGGLVAYCGTNSLEEVRAKANAGEARCKLTLEAMVLQVAQEIAKHGATLSGVVDAIVLTGGMAHDHAFVDAVRSRVEFLGTVVVVPGEREMLSLARAVLSALSDPELIREY